MNHTRQGRIAWTAIAAFSLLAGCVGVRAENKNAQVEGLPDYELLPYLQEMGTNAAGVAVAENYYAWKIDRKASEISRCYGTFSLSSRSAPARVLCGDVRTPVAGLNRMSATALRESLPEIAPRTSTRPLGAVWLVDQQSGHVALCSPFRPQSGQTCISE